MQLESVIIDGDGPDLVTCVYTVPNSINTEIR
jgi:hypothetical protein